MSFHRVDLENWPRRPYFEHDFHTLPCTYSMTADVDVTVLLPWLREKSMRFYPAVIFGLARAVNADPAFCMDVDAEGAVGYHDRMDPSYTIFHKESETFSSLWTAYTPDLAAFCRAWEADMARFGTVPGPVARAPEPGQGIFNVSAVPWTSFTGFNLNLQKGYGYLPPIFTLGKYRTEHGRTLLPLAVQVHHAAAGRIPCGAAFFPSAVVGGQLRADGSAGRGENINERTTACAHRSHDCRSPGRGGGAGADLLFHAWSRNMLAEELDNALSAFLVALDESGKVVGYAGLQVVLDEGYITNVAVRPECRRQGIAGKLLQVFLDFAQGNHLAFLTLEVRASNYDAIALYGSRGFRSVGRRKNYYEHPKEDAIIMTKEFAYGVETGDTGTAGDGV